MPAVGPPGFGGPSKGHIGWPPSAASAARSASSKTPSKISNSGQNRCQKLWMTPEVCSRAMTPMSKKKNCRAAKAAESGYGDSFGASLRVFESAHDHPDAQPDQQHRPGELNQSA